VKHPPSRIGDCRYLAGPQFVGSAHRGDPRGPADPVEPRVEEQLNICPHQPALIGAYPSAVAAPEALKSPDLDPARVAATEPAVQGSPNVGATDT
jgi:hypothetical protein